MRLAFPPRRHRALTLIEAIIIVAVVALVAAFIYPALRPIRALGHPPICMNNLKMIGLAFLTWEGDYNDTYPARYFTNADGTMKFADAANAYRSFQVMSNELNNPRILQCPQDAKRPVATDWESGFSGANISYFIGLDADETQPTRFLSGDRNLTNGLKLKNAVLDVTTNQLAGWTPERHQGMGNVLFADGSVRSLDTKSLNDAITKTGLATNRLALP